jgi:hypothetical protein
VVAAGQAAATGAISASVAALTEGVLKTMFLTKIKSVLATVLVFGVAVVGIGAGVGSFPNSLAVGQQLEAKRGSNKKESQPMPVPPKLPGAGVEKEKKLLTPEQIFRDKFTGEASIEFAVKAVSLNGSPFSMEEATDRKPAPTEQGKSAVSRLVVVVSPKVEARLQQLGIEDLRTHFYGKTVRVMGKLKREIDAEGVGDQLVTYTLTIESLDQLQYVGKKSE